MYFEGQTFRITIGKTQMTTKWDRPEATKYHEHISDFAWNGEIVHICFCEEKG